MGVYFRALVITGGVAFFLGWGFFLWRGHSRAGDGEVRLNQLDSFESQGIPDFQIREFQVKDLGGSAPHVSDLRGKIVIVNFWASWCGPCLEEMPSLISLVESQAGRVQLIAVSGDSNKEDIEAFIKAFPKIRNANIKIVWDEDHSITRSYFVDRLPESFIAGKDLKLVKKIIGTINWHTGESEKFMQELEQK